MSYPYYSSQNKPQYYEGNNETRVVVQTEPEEKRWNWCAHGWSMFAVFCCPWCIFSWMCAFGGLICAVSSYTDHKAGDYDRARYKKGCAIGWTVVAIILGLAVIAVVIYFIVTAVDTVTNGDQSLLEKFLEWLGFDKSDY